MTKAAEKPGESSATTNSAARAIERIEGWRISGRTIHASYFRDPISGAVAIMTLECVIASFRKGSITLKGETGGINAALDGAELFDGPISIIDAQSEERTDIEAVQINLRGGDSLLIAIRPAMSDNLISGGRFRLIKGRSDE